MHSKKNHLSLWFKAFLFAIICATSSCNNFSFHNGITEGKIDYTITYPGIPADSYILDLMPKSMQTTFSNNNYRNDIIAGMGLFKTSIICNSKEDDLTHSVKVLTTKYASKLSEEELLKFNPDFKNIEVTLNKETKKIAGYNCKGADVTVKGDSIWSFKLFYTNEIDIKNANGHTPFKAIEGVLMEYEIFSYDTHMHFLANQVLDEEIDESSINLEDGYEMVTPDKLKAEIEGVFAKVR